MYRDVFSRIVLHILDQFGPDWLLVSAGYDGHIDDPLGGMALTADDYGAMAAALGESMRHTNTVFYLEGGYDIRAISDSVKSTLDGFASGRDLHGRSQIGGTLLGWFIPGRDNGSCCGRHAKDYCQIKRVHH